MHPAPTSQLTTAFHLDLNTLQTAVSFYDRILSLVPITTKQLQICGLAALFFATKVLEMAPFRAEEIDKYFSQVASAKGVYSYLLVRALHLSRSLPRRLDRRHESGAEHVEPTPLGYQRLYVGGIRAPTASAGSPRRACPRPCLNRGGAVCLGHARQVFGQEQAFVLALPWGRVSAAV